MVNPQVAPFVGDNHECGGNQMRTFGCLYIVGDGIALPWPKSIVEYRHAPPRLNEENVIIDSFNELIA
jgi:hypothetical protein